MSVTNWEHGVQGCTLTREDKARLAMIGAGVEAVKLRRCSSSQRADINSIAIDFGG